MNFLDLFKLKTKGKVANLGIGLGVDHSQNLKILRAVEDFLKDSQCKVYLFGTKGAIAQLLEEQSPSNVKLIVTAEPEKEIVEYLKENFINAAIRGNLSSNKFLQHLKNVLEIIEIHRLALLETYNQNQFFFGPVGIDECNNLEKKIFFIEKAITQFKSLRIQPQISILSGGRLGDIGRDPYVDQTIHTAEKVVQYFKEKYPLLGIQHNQILIESAIENGSNLIIAPDGISGNLAYRTLVHLGGGKAYGALYMGLDHTVIDTSRVGNISEIQGALSLALAQVELDQK